MRKVVENGLLSWKVRPPLGTVAVEAPAGGFGVAGLSKNHQAWERYM
jgi:hypothetical protein